MGLHSIPRGHGKDSGLPAPEIMLSVDPQEINRLFMNSAKLDRCSTDNTKCVVGCQAVWLLHGRQGASSRQDQSSSAHCC